MKLAAVILENFRGYRESTRIEIDDLTAFIGRNDAGKSTILEALEIFFNEGKPERGDVCVHGAGTVMRIGCVFSNLPTEIVIDAVASTTLAAEYLLNEDGELEIVKEWDGSAKSPKEAVFAAALHPTHADAADLLTLKNSDLKARMKKLGIDGTAANQTVNGSMRQAIRAHCEPLALERRLLPLDKEDAKKVWEQIKPKLPMYALFRSDRASQDGDQEVQDPLKTAITQALKEMEDDVRKIEEAVRTRAEDVARRTLAKLNEMDGRLAGELKPFFKTEPTWSNVFKFGLVGDNDIPINKRGSGVRRLILLNFFRAEAERRRTEKGALSVIYAIEEPETSQHPDNQRLLVEALKELANGENTQVLVTSHTPGLAGLLPSESLRCVRKQDDGTAAVSHCTDDDLAVIANELGVLPDRRVQALVFVEGTNDIEFFERISAMLKLGDPDVADFTNDNRVALVPLGGGSLKQWVAKHYLKNLSIPEVHIYDRDDAVPPKYQTECDAVNARTDGSWAVITAKREIENYLHADAIAESLGITVNFTDTCDVPLIVAKAIHESSDGAKPWAHILADDKELRDKVSRAKKRLNRDAAAKMTIGRWAQSDATGEVSGWLKKIHGMLR